MAETLMVDSAIARALPTLPAGTAYNVRRMDPTVFPIISYALVSDHPDAVALRDFGLYQITPRLSSIPGLARVDVQGGDTAEVEVLADPQRLAAAGLAMPDLAAAIRNGNVLSAVGQVQDRGREPVPDERDDDRHQQERSARGPKHAPRLVDVLPPPRLPDQNRRGHPEPEHERGEEEHDHVGVGRGGERPLPEEAPDPDRVDGAIERLQDRGSERRQREGEQGPADRPLRQVAACRFPLCCRVCRHALRSVTPDLIRGLPFLARIPGRKAGPGSRPG